MSGALLERPTLWIPGENGDGAALEISNASPSAYLRSLMRANEILDDDHSAVGEAYLSLLLGGKSNYASNKDLDHNLGKSAFTMPTTVAIALLTVAPTAASTGASVTEATYTGYARLAVAAASLNAAASQKSTNSAKLEFAACTAGSSTIIGFIIVDSTTAAAGNALYWGTTTSTVISTTQTPATIAATALEVTES